MPPHDPDHDASATPGDAPTPLEELVERALDALERAGPGAVESLLAAEPELADQARSRLARLEALGLLAAEPELDRPERVGEFEIEDVIAEGGMGVVYRARDAALGRQVALKLVRPELLLVPGARARLRREAEAAAQLAHPNIVALHRFGEQDGAPYLAMELVEGASLAQLLEQRKLRPDDVHIQGRGESWTAECLGVARDVAAALEHAHERGVLHRDVKPSNVLVDQDGRARLVDFGLARLEGSGQLTRTGSQLGSLQYMSPEQLGDSSRDLDGRVDVYGLGVTLYELLVGVSPFEGLLPEEMIRRIREGLFERPRKLAPELSRDVEAVLLQAMAVDPGRRYPDVASFARDLDNLLALRPVQARPPSAWVQLRAWSRRSPRTTTALAVGVLLLVVGALLFERQRRDGQQALAREESRTAAQTAVLGELLNELGFEFDAARVEQDPARMVRLGERLAAIEDRAALLPELGTGDPLEIANGRLTLALANLGTERPRRAEEHLDVARAALERLGPDAPVRLTFRANVVLGELARELDHAALARQGWRDARRAFTELETLGRPQLVDRLMLADGALDEARLARLGGDLTFARSMLEVALDCLDPAPSERSMRLTRARAVLERGWQEFDRQEFEPARRSADEAGSLLSGTAGETFRLRALHGERARIEAELAMLFGDLDGAAASLDSAEQLFEGLSSRQDDEMRLALMDCRLRLAHERGELTEIFEQLERSDVAARSHIDRYGRYESARSSALVIWSNSVAIRFDCGDLAGATAAGERALEVWRTAAPEGESPTQEGAFLLNLSAASLHQGQLDAALAHLERADEVLERARLGGRSDAWIDGVQARSWLNRCRLLADQGRVDDAQEFGERGLALAVDLAHRTDLEPDWTTVARAAQELANVHMDGPRCGHSIEVLEASLARLDELQLRGRLSEELRLERDWQRFSLLTQLLRVERSERARHHLRRGLEQAPHDVDVIVELAALASYAASATEADEDRELAERWEVLADSASGGS